MTTIVFAHGWGFDHHLWDGVRKSLGATHRIETVDFGFFGAPRLPEIEAGEPVIAVGHSLGACWWLAQSDIAWQRLLIVNGFPRFTAADDYAPAVAPRLLSRMQSQFGREPEKVLGDFHARCGSTAHAGGGDPVRLAAGLQWLADWDGRSTLARRAADILVLAGSRDAIVPRTMTEMAFAALPADRVTWSDVPGHVLPLAAPAECARWIAERLG